MRSKRIGLLVGAGSLLTALCLRSTAKHPSNAGPEDPPIKFELPAPKPLSAKEELETFKLQGDFEIQLVASEPLVEDPVAISFDEKGRMWVVEMRGYMHDADATGQDEPSGRIKILEDTRGDGTFDKATVFADGLVMPRAAAPVRGHMPPRHSGARRTPAYRARRILSKVAVQDGKRLRRQGRYRAPAAGRQR